MKKKILISVLCFCLLLQAGIYGIQYFQNKPTNFSSVDRSVHDNEMNYYYQTLSENAKLAYTIIYDALRDHPEQIEIPPLTMDEYNSMFVALSYDHPDSLCLSNESKMRTKGKKAYFIPKYIHSKDVCESRRALLEQKVDEICKGLKPKMSPYEVELYFHDYICQNTVYDQTSPIGYTAYDALVEGEAVCEGYSRAMQLLLQHEGIQSYLVTGKAVDDKNGEDFTQGHMWNVVRIEGQNYYLDVTWDDIGEKKSDEFQHNYFNLTETDILRDHKDLEPTQNHCDSIEYNYFVKERSFFTAYNKATKQRIVELMQKALQNKNEGFEIQFKDKNVYQKAKKALIDNGELFDLLKKADIAAYKKYRDISYINIDELGTMQFLFGKKENDDG